jgi:hypothetical protein
MELQGTTNEICKYGLFSPLFAVISLVRSGAVWNIIALDMTVMVV